MFYHIITATSTGTKRYIIYQSGSRRVDYDRRTVIASSITYITCITITVDVDAAHTTEEEVCIMTDNQSAEENRRIIESSTTITTCTITIDDQSTEDEEESSCLTDRTVIGVILLIIAIEKPMKHCSIQ